MSKPDESENFSKENSDTEEVPYTPAVYTRYTDGENSYAMAEKYLSDLPELNFDGAVFFLTTTNRDYIDPDTTETNVAKKTVERNRKIEEKYNISLLTSVTDGQTMLQSVKNAVASDTYYTDLMMIPLYLTGQFRMSGTLMNLRSLPFLDLSQPYFNEESIEMTSGGYATYGTAGSASLSPSAFSAMFFNRDLVEEAGMELPYSSVVAGQWTWDRFFTYVEGVSALNGEGRQISSYGTQNNASRIADLTFISCGNTYISAAEKRIPKISFTRKSAKYAVGVAHRLLTDEGNITDPEAGAIAQFTNGSVLFLNEYLYTMPWMTNASTNWGVLPMPKESEEDSYRTLVSNNELIFTVPANHKNGEMVSVVLSALNAGSYGHLYDEYIEHSMIHVLRDNDSINMLDLILDTAAFDFSLAFGNAYPTIAAGTYGLIRESALADDLETRFTDAVTKTRETLSTYFNLTY